jgi:hypothetical protein
MFILKINDIIEGQILKRPSKQIKSPYVADANINNQEFLAHTASLGCCGLADVNAIVLISLSPESKSKSKPKNKANMKQKQLEYYECKKDQLKEKALEYYYDNKVTVIERMREYNKQYWEENKAKISEKRKWK